MGNTPFLLQVARHYANESSLEDFCYVFPNRRSGQFFAHYLQRQLVAVDAQRPHLMPCVTAINDFVAQFTGTATATDIEMMFALYDAYCQTMGDEAQEFDKFIYWAQLIIGDFNDIDKSLADADGVYRNLSDLHDLSSNYLSPEVQEKVKKIFGESLFTAFFDTRADADLWRRFAESGAKPTGDDHDTAGVKQEFESLWRALSTIYHKYHDALRQRGVVSPGMQLRQAVERPRPVTRYRKLVFVGFGVLSAAEIELFEQFKRDGKADFWWDNASVHRQLQVAPHDPGALLIDGYCKRFPAPVSLESIGDTFPAIRVVGVPSTIGQAKVAFDEVALIGGKGIETAVVLPDENLLVPLLHSAHGVEDINVTLGYPLRGSGIVSLMHIVARLHHQASLDQNEWSYYREDINDILSHPLIKTYFSAEALSMASRLAVANRFRVPACEFSELSFYDLFKPAMSSDSGKCDQELQADYLEQLLSFCNLLMDKMRQPSQEVEEDDDDGNEAELSLQQAFLAMYIDVLNQLKSSLALCDRSLQRSTVFYLIDRLTATAVVPFTGMPLKGLQVMGLLETRSLDFDNIVILSMNERIFPRHRSINSFIPNYIRRALGMSTTEQQEAIVAFNFYRLLNRSRHVTLIYDSSSQSLGTSEPSRYIAQLEKVYGIKLHRVEVAVKPNTSSPIEIAVPNRDGMLREIYTREITPNGRAKYLSASVINKYIACPLTFYLQVVQGLNDDNEASDFMDSGSFGNIIHDTLNDCYRVDNESGKGRVFSRDDIALFRKRHLDTAIVRNIKKHLLNVPADKLDSDTTPLRGEALMIVDTIKSYVNFALDYDLELIDKYGPFTVLECEKRHEVPLLQIGDERINFTYKPDRVDCVNGVVRIVDYKTGGDVTYFKPDDNLRELFEGTIEKRRKAILQLFLYCYAYLTEHEDVKQVMPFIYKVPSMKDSGVLVGAEKTPDKPQYVFEMGDAIAQDFISRMADTIKGMFDNDFIQAPLETKSGCCDYCRFIDICRRMQQEKKW